jgi:diguanylate cyclase (GGDEF)-like protein/PAS domain S-box-containing protein
VKKLSIGDYNQLQGALWLESDTFFLQIVQDAWDTFGVFDASGKLLFASSSYYRNIGFVPSRMEELFARIDSGYRMDLRKLFLNAAQMGKKGRLEFRFRHMDERWIWFETQAIPIRGSDGMISHIAFLTNDITAKKQHESKLIAMAYHDPLTGLPNRRLFKEHLNQALLQAKRTGKTMALLYLDIDDFKVINDTMGHDIGDGFLQSFADRIRGCLREVDMFARMGGDEFTILLPMMDSESHVETVANRIFQSIEEPYELDGHRFHSSISMGIALYPTDGEDSNALLKKVDTALYQVKGKGRNAFQFFKSNLYNSHD